MKNTLQYYAHTLKCKIIACLLSGALLATSMPTDLFAEQGVIPQTSLQVPLSAGVVSDQFQGKTTNPHLYLIQDAHAHYGVQKNIATLAATLRTHGITTAFLEGSNGPLDISLFRGFPIKETLRACMDDELKTAEITGIEHYAITGDDPIFLYGIEKESLYVEHVAVCKQALEHRHEAETILAQERARVKESVNASVSDSVRAFLTAREQYEKGERESLDYYRSLFSLCEAEGISWTAFPHFSKLYELACYEKNIDLSMVRKETTALVKRLIEEGNLSPDEVTHLADHEIEYRGGRLAAYNFYTYLRQLVGRNITSLDLRSYTHSNRYYHYLTLVHDIDSARLEKERTRIETIIISHVGKKYTGETLMRRYEALRTITKMIHLEMTRTIKPIDSYPDDPELNALLPLYARFYLLAHAREKESVKRMIREMRERKLASSMVIMGGYHTEGLTALLKQKEISYTVLTPRVDVVENRDLYMRRIEHAFTSFGVKEGANGGTVAMFDAIQKLVETQANKGECERLRSRILPQLVEALRVHPERDRLIAEWNKNTTECAIVEQSKTGALHFVTPEELFATLRNHENDFQQIVRWLEDGTIGRMLQEKESTRAREEIKDSFVVSDKGRVIPSVNRGGKTLQDLLIRYVNRQKGAFTIVEFLDEHKFPRDAALVAYAKGFLAGLERQGIIECDEIGIYTHRSQVKEDTVDMSGITTIFQSRRFNSSARGNSIAAGVSGLLFVGNIVFTEYCTTGVSALLVSTVLGLGFASLCGHYTAMTIEIMAARATHYVENVSQVKWREFFLVTAGFLRGPTISHAEEREKNLTAHAMRRLTREWKNLLFAQDPFVFCDSDLTVPALTDQTLKRIYINVYLISRLHPTRQLQILAHEFAHYKGLSESQAYLAQLVPHRTAYDPTNMIHVMDMLVRSLQNVKALLSRVEKAVTIFGGNEADEEWLAFGNILGAKLRAHKLVPRTGGGPGMMMAVLAGYQDARELSWRWRIKIVLASLLFPILSWIPVSWMRSLTKGLTQGFKLHIKGQPPNKAVELLYFFDHFIPRKMSLIRRAHMILVAYGGYGTLDELIEVLRTDRKIVLAKTWKPVIDAMTQSWDLYGWKEPVLADITYMEDPKKGTIPQEEKQTWHESIAETLASSVKEEGGAPKSGELDTTLGAIDEMIRQTERVLPKLHTMEDALVVIGSSSYDDEKELYLARTLASNAARKGIPLRIVGTGPLSNALLLGIQDAFPTAEEREHYCAEKLQGVFYEKEKNGVTIRKQFKVHNTMITSDPYILKLILTEKVLGHIAFPGRLGTFDVITDVTAFRHVQDYVQGGKERGTVKPVVLVNKDFWQPWKYALITAIKPYIKPGAEDIMQVVDHLSELNAVIDALAKKSTQEPPHLPRENAAEKRSLFKKTLFFVKGISLRDLGIMGLVCFGLLIVYHLNTIDTLLYGAMVTPVQGVTGNVNAFVERISLRGEVASLLYKQDHERLAELFLQGQHTPSALLTVIQDATKADLYTRWALIATLIENLRDKLKHPQDEHSIKLIESVIKSIEEYQKQYATPTATQASPEGGVITKPPYVKEGQKSLSSGYTAKGEPQDPQQTDRKIDGFYAVAPIPLLIDPAHVYGWTIDPLYLLCGVLALIGMISWKTIVDKITGGSPQASSGQEENLSSVPVHEESPSAPLSSDTRTSSMETFILIKKIWDIRADTKALLEQLQSVKRTMNEKDPAPIRINHFAEIIAICAMVKYDAMAKGFLKQIEELDPEHPFLPLLRALAMISRGAIDEAWPSIIQLGREAVTMNDDTYRILMVNLLVYMFFQREHTSSKKFEQLVTRIATECKAEENYHCKYDIHVLLIRALTYALNKTFMDRENDKTREKYLRALMVLTEAELSLYEEGFFEANAYERERKAEAYFYQSRCYYELRGDFHESIKLLTKALSLQPDEKNKKLYMQYLFYSHISLVIKALREGHTEEAAHEYTRAMSLSMDDDMREYSLYKGVLDYIGGNAEEGIRCLIMLCKSYPEETMRTIYMPISGTSAQTMLMECVLNERVPEDIRFIVARLMKDCEAKYVKGEIKKHVDALLPLIARGEYEKALRELSIRQCMNPSYNYIRDVQKKVEAIQRFVEQGNQFYATGNYSSALQSYQSALKLNPTDQNLTEKIANVKQVFHAENEKKKPFDEARELLISARAQESMGKYTKAYEKYKRVLAVLETALGSLGPESMIQEARDGIIRTEGKETALHQKRDEEWGDEETTEIEMKQPAQVPTAVSMTRTYEVRFASRLTADILPKSPREIHELFQLLFEKGQYEALNKEELPKKMRGLNVYKLYVGTDYRILYILINGELLALGGFPRQDEYPQMLRAIGEDLKNPSRAWKKAKRFGTYTVTKNIVQSNKEYDRLLKRGFRVLDEKRDAGALRIEAIFFVLLSFVVGVFSFLALQYVIHDQLIRGLIGTGCLITLAIILKKMYTGREEETPELVFDDVTPSVLADKAQQQEAADTEMLKKTIRAFALKNDTHSFYRLMADLIERAQSDIPCQTMMREVLVDPIVMRVCSEQSTVPTALVLDEKTMDALRPLAQAPERIQAYMNMRGMLSYDTVVLFIDKMEKARDLQHELSTLLHIPEGSIMCLPSVSLSLQTNFAFIKNVFSGLERYVILCTKEDTQFNRFMNKVIEDSVDDTIRVVTGKTYADYIIMADLMKRIATLYSDMSTPQHRILSAEAQVKLGSVYESYRTMMDMYPSIEVFAQTGILNALFADSIEHAVQHMEKQEVVARAA